MADGDVYLSAIAAGDSQAFAAWLAGGERRVRLSLHRFAASVDTEAVMQETLLRIWQLAPRHTPDGRPDSLLRLAIRIARNLAIDEVRRLRTVAVDDPELVAAQERNGEPQLPEEPDPALRELIRRCLEALTGKPRGALLARLHRQGEPDRGLAERLGMRINTFLQNVTRARRQVAECLERHGVPLDEVWR